MSDTTYGPTIAKRRLSRRLAQLRAANGYTANQVCDKLDWGRGKVGRFESNVWRRPEMSDIRDLLRLYEKSEDTRRELEELAIRARERTWWRDYQDIFENEFPGYEEDAAVIHVYVPLLVPGLLQTAAYIEAFMAGGTRSKEWRERAIETRLRRQRILDREDPEAPRLVAVITEASLMYEWGSQADRRAQVAHLVEMSTRPNVELRIARFADGPAGESGTVDIFEYPGDEPDVVFAETEFAIHVVADEAYYDAHRESFQYVRSVAAGPSVTTAHLKELAQRME